MRKLILMLILFVGIAQIATAQRIPTPDPVKWDFKTVKKSATEYDLVFTANIDDGWAVYESVEDEDKGPIPIEFDFDKQRGVNFQGKIKMTGQSREVYDKVFETKVVKGEKKVHFTQRVKGVKGKTVEGELLFMTCDGHRCLRPKTVPFRFTLR